MRKKLFPFITILTLALFLGACNSEDVMPEIGSETNPELTERTISFTASMPGEDDPATRVGAAEEADRGITLTWDENDKLDLLFVQGDNKFHESTTVTNIENGGKNATFTVPLPDGITDGTPYNLYGVYGGGAVSTTNPALIGLPAIEGTTLNEENVGKKVMLRFAKEGLNLTDAVGAVNFEHVGFLFTAKIKTISDTAPDITSVQLVGADATNETWAYNASENHFDMEAGTFTAEGTRGNAVNFQNSKKDATNNILTVRNWLPGAQTEFPTLKLSVNGTATAETKPARTLEVGRAYYLYATWDGTNLNFAGRADVEPADGTKEKPYSVAEAIADVYVDGSVVKDKWVKGFIVGSFNNGSIFGTDNASQYNINIADNKDATTGADVINVQLTNTKGIRATFNLIENTEMYKAEVLFKGDIEKYNNLPGLKQTSDFVILSTTPLFQANNTPITFTSSLELTRTITITTNDTQAWTATSSDESWLTVAPANGTGSGNVVITATENTDTAAGRAATITLTPTDNAELAPIVIDVTQEKLLPLINVDPTAIAFTTASGSKTLTVNSNVTWTASATIIDGAPDWLTITPTTGNSGETTISATATENTTFAARSATINITDGAGISIDVAVTQEAVIPFLNVDPTVLALDKEAATNVPVAITANVTWTAAVNTEATWLTISPESGANDGTILVSAEANSGADARNATITITPEASSGLPAIEYSVTQAGAVAVFAEELFISEYIEGSGYNKMIEIFNGTGETVDLTGYALELYDNGKTTAQYSQQLSGMLEHGKVVVVYHSSATISIPAGVMKFANNNVCNHNGDDAFALTKNGVKIDIIGTIGEKKDWSKGGNLGTKDKTLVRKPEIKKGNAENKADFESLETEWIGYPKDTGNYIGFHDTNY